MNLLYASSLALDSGPSPCASRLAVWSIAALSGLLPAAMISATAMAAAWKPLATAAWRMWTGNGVLDRFLEDESLFGEFLRTPVSEGGVESLVVEPPHIVVEVGA